MSEGSDPAEPDVRREGERSPGSFAFGDDLELNRFDGLPFSSRYYKLLKERKTLPVWKVKCEFEDALVSSHVVIVSGTARTGTSTQIPQWCAEFCLSARYQHGVAACTQTSRRRAVDLALRVADEMDVNVGHEVGYAIPLETCCSSDTVLRYCTDDMLLREMLSDPFLEHYGVIIVDQAHNRTVSTDILLGLLRDILLHRPELRVVVLAVGPTVDRLRRHFGNVPLIRLEASCTAEVVHSTGTGTSQDHFYSALRLVLELHRSKEDGDVAVFLASDEEVPCAYRILRREGTRLGVDLGPLEPVVLGPGQSGPPPALSAQPTPKKPRRVYLCSRQGEDLCWAAEAVGFVIDAGVQKKMVYNPRIRANSEALQPISQCQADIRKQLSEPGGKFFCLYSEEKQLPAENSPQILESNITATVLFLKRMEIAGLRQCDFIDRPDFSAEKWCQDYFLDHSALTKAEAIRSELSDTLHRIELPVSEPSFGTKANALSIRRALLAGFFMQIARDVDGCGNYFILTHKHMAQVHPLSCYGAQSHKMGLPEWVVFHEYMLSENCMRTVSQISPREFIQMAPLYFFYNLPPSESKDILQDMLDPDGSRKRKEEKQTDAALSSDGNNGCAVALQTYDRCAIQ
ncbi:DEAD/H (Asp-Glu-Ala-Asp/His) box polypeptide 32a isoform X3 [Betta splendens]|uniref:DEAD/H (Asp-Glu-Ala-Asp/His) box polypeptide 32a isoform X3 n=1 Tax=Betta splendens TaxID=158456 RepID=A0A6P7L8V4_BETSP|nr:DEAD/H (Asp-Glu-Ala-Asp/His) box polypeptide 32a isoform X3 [Betta splendens]